MQQTDVGITIRADNPRTIRAIEIAAQADRWLRWRTDDGLETFGVLALGHKESIHFTPFVNRYEEIDTAERIYRKVA